jgi:hypothetical protein
MRTAWHKIPPEHFYTAHSKLAPMRIIAQRWLQTHKMAHTLESHSQLSRLEVAPRRQSWID